MLYLRTRSVFAVLLLSLAVLFALPAIGLGQTFCGAIEGADRAVQAFDIIHP